MIKAEEARKITEKSKVNIDLSSILDELGKVVEKNASFGMSKAFIMKTADQLTKESKTVPGNVIAVCKKLKAALEELGYATDMPVRIADRDPSSAEYRYKIEVSW